MARLNTTELQIKVSKLQKDTDDDEVLMDTETIIQLETIIAEIVGAAGVIVEISELK